MHSRLHTYMIVALTVACVFFAYEYRMTALDRDAIKIDLDFQLRKIESLELEKRGAYNCAW